MHDYQCWHVMCCDSHDKSPPSPGIVSVADNISALKINSGCGSISTYILDDMTQLSVPRYAGTDILLRIEPRSLIPPPHTKLSSSTLTPQPGSCEYLIVTAGSSHFLSLYCCGGFNKLPQSLTDASIYSFSFF